MNARYADERIDDLIHTLGVVDLNRARPVLDDLTRELATLFDCGTLAYRAAPGPDSWELDFAFARGLELESRVLPAFERFLTRAPVQWAAYDALRPQPNQRDRVLGTAALRKIGAENTPLVREVYEPVGLHRTSQMRALVCDGPWLLTWIGGFRDEPFTSLEESALARLIAPLQRQLQVDRILGGSCSFGTLASALEAIASPAFLARPTGAIDFANEAGRRLFTCRGSSLAHSLRSALAAPERAAHATVLPLHSVGAHGLALIVLRGERVSDDARLSMVRARWGLTAREGEVLALTARGDANKDIAAKLRCSPRTAERHVTALLRKAKVDTRARLVAKYWTET